MCDLLWQWTSKPLKRDSTRDDSDNSKLEYCRERATELVREQENKRARERERVREQAKKRESSTTHIITYLLTAEFPE